MPNVKSAHAYRGVFPVAPSIFNERGELDLDGQRRVIDFMIDAGVDGICILANFSEQFSLRDEERELLIKVIIKHAAGRVPVIVTTSHFCTAVCAERSRRAQDAGAALVMIMPPYHGATIRPSEAAIFEFFSEISKAIDIPIILQDAPVSGTLMSAHFLARLARELPNISHFKIEVPGTATKLIQLIDAGGSAIAGPWDGEEGITLLVDLQAGATGTMTGGGYPDAFRKIFDLFWQGNREQAAVEYARWLPLINFENRQCGLQAAKILMKEGGIIASDAVRHPLTPAHSALRAELIKIACALDPLVLRWAR